MSPNFKPWTVESFLAETRAQGAVYIRKKGVIGVASLVQSIHPEGVNVFYCKGDGMAGVINITWMELLLTCEQVDGRTCGVRK